MMQLSRDKETYQQEVYGIVGIQGAEYIPKKLIAASEARAPVTEQFNPPHIWIAIDPASHGSSEMGILAFGMTSFGVHVILGMSSVNVHRCQTSEVQLIIHDLLKQLRQHPLIDVDCVFIPIIECNNNEILSMSLLRVFESYGPIHIPFIEERFKTDISHGIGIWTTRENKMAAIQCTYQAYFDGRICYAEQISVADRTSFHVRARPRTSKDLISLLGSQLHALKDQADGTVSGKDMGPDDIACAMLIGIYWSQVVRAIFAEEA